MDNPLKYSADIDQKIVEAIEEGLDISVVSAKKINSGEVSFAYKIKTKEKGNLIAKVFKFKNFVVDKEKLLENC